MWMLQKVHINKVELGYRKERERDGEGNRERERERVCMRERERNDRNREHKTIQCYMYVRPSTLYLHVHVSVQCIHQANCHNSLAACTCTFTLHHITSTMLIYIGYGQNPKYDAFLLKSQPLFHHTMQPMTMFM